MPVVKGRNIRVEVAATYGTPIAVSAITLALPGVMTAAAHGLPNDTVGYFDEVTGMVQLNGQAARLKNTTANTAELQGLATTKFGAFTGGKFVPALTWETIAESTSYSIGGGDAEKLNTTTLLDVIRQEENGLLAAQSLSMNVLAMTVPTAAMQLIEAAAQQGLRLLTRITHLVDGAVRVGFGEPSFPGEDVQQGAVGTGTLNFSVKGFILKLPA